MNVIFACKEVEHDFVALTSELSKHSITILSGVEHIDHEHIS